MGTFENRRWVIIPTTSIGEINFSNILETSENTLRKSVDGTKTFIKYDGIQPVSVASITGVSSEYNHSEIGTVLNTPEWSLQEPLA